MKITISDIDVVFLSYDEPKADSFYADLKQKCPWAKRVHGVKGFDNAHKACADLSETDRFITVDGDNIVDSEFFSRIFDVPTDQSDCVFSWAGLNMVNGLLYGNGGLKCWPTEYVKNMTTHENAGNDGAVDFCWDDKYVQMEESFSQTYPNGSPFQAFRAGFREGVKMTLDRGRKVSLYEIDNGKLWHGNMKRLAIWCSVGADVENGLWSIYGTRCGVNHTNLVKWDHNLITDYDWFIGYWNHYIKPLVKTETNLNKEIAILGGMLRRSMGLQITELNADASRFFKYVYVAPSRTGYK